MKAPGPGTYTLKYSSVDVNTDTVSRNINLGSERRTFLDEIQIKNKSTNQVSLNSELGCCDRLLTKLVRFAKEVDQNNKEIS